MDIQLDMATVVGDIIAIVSVLIAFREWNKSQDQARKTDETRLAQLKVLTDEIEGWERFQLYMFAIGFCVLVSWETKS